MAVPKIWRKIKEHYNLVGNRCNECGNLIFPGRDVCNKCGSVELSEHKFKGYGEIVTFSIIRTPFSDPEGENIEIPARHIPYAIAIIKLEEGPMLTCQIVDTSSEQLKIGVKVEMVFRKILEKGKKGVIQYGYKFRAAD